MSVIECYGLAESRRHSAGFCARRCLQEIPAARRRRVDEASRCWVSTADRVHFFVNTKLRLHACGSQTLSGTSIACFTCGRQFSPGSSTADTIRFISISTSRARGTNRRGIWLSLCEALGSMVDSEVETAGVRSPNAHENERHIVCAAREVFVPLNHITFSRTSPPLLRSVRALASGPLSWPLGALSASGPPSPRRFLHAGRRCRSGNRPVGPLPLRFSSWRRIASRVLKTKLCRSEQGGLDEAEYGIRDDDGADGGNGLGLGAEVNRRRRKGGMGLEDEVEGFTDQHEFG